MKSFLYVLASIFLVYGLGSCSATENKDSESENNDKAENTTTEEKPSPMVDAISIWDGISVREEPSSDGKWISSISLGEKVLMTGNSAVDSSDNNREYVEIRLGDDKQGWAVKDFVEEGTAVAVVSKAQLFKRPDLLTKTDKSFTSMDVLALMDTNDDWVEVKGKSQGEKWFWSGWIKRIDLTDDEVDVAVAVYGQKALQIKDEGKRIEAIQDIVENESFTSSMFIEGLQIELNKLNTVEEELVAEPTEDMETVEINESEEAVEEQ